MIAYDVESLPLFPLQGSHVVCAAKEFKERKKYLCTVLAAILG